MATNWMRRTVMVAACATAALLAACGSSTIESALTPDRFIAFGDAFSDVGQKGARYTVNDGSVSNWTQQLASRYGKTITPAASGGLSYATGNARITIKPDVAGDATTLTVTEQIDRFLAGGSFGSNDVVFVNAGTSDVIAGVAAVRAGTLSKDDMLAETRKAGQQLATQVRRLVTSGAKYVVVMGTYDMTKSVWATAINEASLLHDASTSFNTGLSVGIVDLGANVLSIDAAYYVNLYTNAPGSYGFDNAKTPVCTSVDAGNGIGIGTGQVNSALCTAATLLPGANQSKYVFADAVYLTPSAHRQLGDYAYDRLRARW
ncbi:GDSL family lipase [Acidovorax carolinensis]|uniref:GDSL family lipase n=1 Tax=Acidovorax carolinensis TaxID=553814 RepID=A0A240UG30_9BURK|nr:SGNH/GDSL hydrolase family protein [Acidovorax carolinensis]ART53941.1 GDSL family lipase [Acidovorax carolinensis]ART60457.1 GDSL family lipase [Acidovorax carolinensis]